MVPHIRITRWRRGSFLTIYKMETNHNTQWWFYGPFNLAVGFSYPTDQCMEDRRPKADESGAVPRARVPGDQKYWN